MPRPETANSYRLIYKEISIGPVRKALSDLDCRTPVNGTKITGTRKRESFRSKVGDDKCRILALDGGGAKGFYTLGVLKQLEVMLQAPLHERFDYVYGTSTGAIIATLIALGYSIDKIHEHQLRNVLFKNIPTVRISDSFTTPDLATDLTEYDLKKLNLLRQHGVKSFGKREHEMREFLKVNVG